MSHSIRRLLFAEGEALMHANRAEDAAVAFEKALKEAGNLPSTPTIALALADAYRETKPEYALRILLSYASVDATHGPELLARAGDILGPATATLLAPLLEDGWRWLTDAEPERTAFSRLLFAADVYASANLHTQAHDTLRRAGVVATDTAQRQNVAQHLYDLAKNLNVANQFEAAVAVLRDAIDLDPRGLPARWLLSEVLRRWSYPENSAELLQQGLKVGEAAIRESAQVWTQAAAMEDSVEAWALSSRAMISEQLGKLPDADRWTTGWEAVAYALRAMLARGYDYADDYATLARCYRALDLSACELALARHAVEVASDEDEKRAAKEELLVATANAGEYDRALQIIDELGQSPWTDAVKAFVRARQDAPAEAIALIEGAIASNYREPWCFELRAQCYRDAGDTDRFWQACETTWNDQSSSDDEALQRRGRAGLFLALRSGAFDDVKAVVAQYTARPSLPTDESPDELLGLFALAQGDAAAARKHLQRSLALTSRKRELEDLRRDVRFIETHLPVASRDAAPAFTQIREAIAAREAELAGSGGPRGELSELLATRPEDDAGEWLWVSAHAALAGFDAWQGDHQAAAARYVRVLEEWPDKMPEARRALDECAKQLLTDADGGVANAATAEDRAASLSVYEWLTQQRHVDSDIRGDAWAAVTFAHVLHGSMELARPAFQASMTAYEESTSLFSPSWRLGGRLANLIRRASDFWKVWDAIVRFVPIASDRRELEEQLVAWFGATYNSQPTRKELEWLPIILELGDGLIPEDAETNYQNWTLFKTYIPELRNWFVTQYGVPIGSIRVRGNLNLNPAEFAILIEEVPVPLANDSVRLGTSFVISTRRRLLDAGVSDDEIEETRHPFNGKPAYWVRASHTRLVAAGLQVDEPLRFAVEQLRQVLCRRLHEFVDPDLVDALVTAQCQTAEEQALVNEVLPTSSARFRFSRLLRALVRDRVPVWNVPEILEAIRGVHLYPTARDAAVKAVRLRLRSRLPGNDAGWHHVAIPSDVETSIIEAMANPEDGCAARIETDVSAMVAAAWNESSDGITLTTTRYETAAYLREVLHREMWNVTALCQQELYERAPATVSAVAS